MANLSQVKREKMLCFLEKLKEEHSDDESLIAINEIEKELTSKKYGLVWEEHEEEVDVKMRTHIPVFTEDNSKEIVGNPESEDFNFLLEGDNLHSLKLLEKTHKGKIDVIYIDPPYNTGKKDFVYDDQHVDTLDAFRHSKWLSFMNERLLLARKLLKNTGIIIISIGYQEVSNLMILCEEIFANKQITCVTVQTSGGKPNGGFNFVHEYLIYITSADFQPNAMSFTGGNKRSPFEGLTLSTFDKTTRPNQTYPIFIDTETGHIVGVGKSLAERISDKSYQGEKADFQFDYNEAPEGTVAVFPISNKGVECVWRLIPERLLSDWKKGYIKVGKNKSKNNPNQYSIQYLPEGVIKKINNGTLKIVGTEKGMPTLILGENVTVGSEIPTIWTEKSFFTTKGTTLLKDIFQEKAFSYPKSLEYVMEILQGVLKDNCLVLDFFAGSGTTGQAVMELNYKNNTKNKFILCTNNESNICENVTYPRVKTVIMGKRADGTEYSEGIPANLKYYKTDFVAKNSEDLYDDLLEHVIEMIQLEYGVKVDNKKYVIIKDDDDMDNFEKCFVKYTELMAVFINQDVLLSTSQEKLLADVNTFIIPDCYFDFELREAGELW